MSWAAWDGERDAVRGEEVRREGFFTSESASGLVQKTLSEAAGVGASAPHETARAAAIGPKAYSHWPKVL